MPARRTTLITTLALAAAVGLAGCVSTPEPAASPSAEAPETTTAPSESQEADDSQAAPSGDVAAPGTEFAFGDPATVEILNLDDEPQLVQLTVTGTREGSIDDFEAAGLEQDFLDQLVGYQPVYVDIEMTQVGPMTAELGNEAIYTDFGGIDQNDSGLQDISVYGTFEPCDTASIDAEFDSGTAHETCVIIATREGQELGGITYGPNDTDYDDYDGEPLVWRA